MLLEKAAFFVLLINFYRIKTEGLDGDKTDNPVKSREKDYFTSNIIAFVS